MKISFVIMSIVFLVGCREQPKVGDIWRYSPDPFFHADYEVLDINGDFVKYKKVGGDFVESGSIYYFMIDAKKMGNFSIKEIDFPSGGLHLSVAQQIAQDPNKTVPVKERGLVCWVEKDSLIIPANTKIKYLRVGEWLFEIRNGRLVLVPKLSQIDSLISHK